MAKIAANLGQADSHAHAASGTQVIAMEPGWTVVDSVCASGPHSVPFEEQHERSSISLVLSGTFQYRSNAGRETLIPGSVLLGNMGQFFECSHQHGTGDHCLSFQYTPEWLASLAESAKLRFRVFKASHLPALKELSPLTSRIRAALFQAEAQEWEALSLQLAGTVLDMLQDGAQLRGQNPPAAEARITKIVRAIEHRPEADWNLAAMAEVAKLSPYHCLRLFEQITGVSPHQYVRRMRLRQAASLLRGTHAKIIDIVGACGFQDVSNFNRAFRAEFGVNPRRFRL